MNPNNLSKGISNTPLISVALPVYNGEKYLVAAIDSILAQTFTDFELIIIDDGSTDDSLSILRKYEKRDARIRLISRENKNLVATLNEIVGLARGKWIARMDQDDIALPHRFARQLEWLAQTEADICGSWVQFFGTADKRILKHPQSDAALKMEILFGCPFAHPSVMMKASLAKLLPYDNAWEKCEDYDLWERAARAGWKMTNVPEVLLRYRQHTAQISTATSDKQQELTQKIRRRYWIFNAEKLGLQEAWITEVLKLREATPTDVNMDAVDAAFMELLQRNHGEARVMIFDHATRLYFRAAAECPNISARWGELNKKFGDGFALGIKIKLQFLSWLSIKPNSVLFNSLKMLKKN